MFRLVLFASLLVPYFSLATKVVLIPSESVSYVAELVVADGAPLTILCKPERSLGWLYQGGANSRETGAIKESSTLHIASFDPKRHIGLYVCYEDDSERSASVRIYSKRRDLPAGYSECDPEEESPCEKGHCAVDSMGSKICMCYPGWHGKYCDMAIFARSKKIIHR